MGPKTTFVISAFKEGTGSLRVSGQRHFKHSGYRVRLVTLSPLTMQAWHSSGSFSNFQEGPFGEVDAGLQGSTGTEGTGNITYHRGVDWMEKANRA